MEELWINPARAVEVLNRAGNHKFTLRDLKTLCAIGRCPAYISCDDATGLEIETNREVRASGNQLLVNPEKLRVTTLEYVDHPIINTLTILKHIVVQGPTQNCREESDSGWSSFNTIWKLNCETTRYCAVFRSSDIEALTKDTITIQELINSVPALPRPVTLVGAKSITTSETNEIAKLQQQLEIERNARRLAEEKLESATTSVKTSYLLTVAGMLELLLSEQNKPHYDQGKIAAEIEDKGWRGASASTLTKLFAEAKAAAAEAEKITLAKAEAREKLKKQRINR
ncbi:MULTISPECIES: hypothetical protein [Pseudomonas]|uniref:hypothetical protein n=1 Tax=Pseudomonas TaxID=286 RepID=UPI0012AD4731|nr:MULTISPECIES: hypothetical protein [Pseudomonas]MCK2112458.1 hypothetical protein [Pseudomonas juntendi]MCK2116968.1 hypothetical protein [Pseudomonas juntendi]MRT63218.1 hypothetical protein [Pseudomonas sp. CAH-1]